MEINNAQDLMKYVAGRKDLLIFVTGPTGSGKSTIVSTLATKLHMKAVHPGKVIRESKNLVDLIAKSNNPSAPKITEKFVRDYVKKKIKKHKDVSVAIDGMPRSYEQVTYCVDTALDFDRTLIFVHVSAPLEIRVKRLLTRDHKGDAELLYKKLGNDEHIFPELVSRIRQVVETGKFGEFYEIYNRRSCDGKELGVETKAS